MSCLCLCISDLANKMNKKNTWHENGKHFISLERKKRNQSAKNGETTGKGTKINLFMEIIYSNVCVYFCVLASE